MMLNYFLDLDTSPPPQQTLGSQSQCTACSLQRVVYNTAMPSFFLNLDGSSYVSMGHKTVILIIQASLVVMSSVGIKVSFAGIHQNSPPQWRHSLG